MTASVPLSHADRCLARFNQLGGNGPRLRVQRGRLPGVAHYYLLVATGQSSQSFPWQAAQELAAELALTELGDPEAFTVLYNGARTRRCPWPHVHVILARTVAEKRCALLCFHLKHLTRWWRWPLLRRLARRPEWQGEEEAA
jgi:hypothetical protein